MAEFSFKKMAEKVEILCKESIGILSTCQESEIKSLVLDFEQFFADYQKKTKLTIGFIGQYNAGKSTLIKALTGDLTVRISAEICTDRVTEYCWKQVLLVDTPGVYASRIDHDQITLDQLSRCDLLVFVVSNELFNPQGGAFFRKVACDMQRVGQMALVVNKMSRETGKIENLIKTILEVIEPHHPHDFYTCFVDADSQLKAQFEGDEEEKQFLIEESNFDNFLSSIQQLIHKNEIYARLVTPLHQAVDILDRSRNLLSADDKLSRDLLEILRRKVLLLRASKTRFQNDFRSRLNDFEHEILMLGDEVASKVDGYHGEEEINLEIKRAEQKIEALSDEASDLLQSDLKNELANLQSEFENLMQSPLGRALIEEFAVASSGGQRFGHTRTGFETGLPPIFKNLPEMIQSVSRFASTVSRDLVYNVGKFLGIKFKPWGAVKGAKFINGLGAVIGVVGTTLDIFFTVKEEQDKAEFERKLREARAELRQKFREVASQLRNDYEKNIKESVLTNFYDLETQATEQQQSEIRDSKSLRSELVEEIGFKVKEIKLEISSILNS